MRSSPRRSLVLLLGAVSVAAVAYIGSASAAAARPDFNTPNSAAYCDLLPGYHATGGVSGGFINSGDPDEAAIGCWTPNDGFSLRMSNTGSVFPEEYRADSRGHMPRTRRVLQFGQTKRMRGITCRSRKSGLTCRNRDGHGWWLGRFMGYRAF